MPDATGHVVPRLRFSGKMDRNAAKKAILILAPSGYGKTTAVRDWLRRGQRSAAWLSLDKRDNDPLLFWKYISQALSRTFDPSIDSDTRYVFALHELFNTNIHIQIILDKICAIGSDNFLVLDDIHEIVHPRIWDSLSFFIQYLPANMHLILISRTEPQLNLAQLEIKEQLARLTKADLQFYHREISDFFEKRGHRLNDKETDLIEQYSEGWAAALEAAAISMDNDHFEIEGNDVRFKSMAVLEQYLFTEVFSTLDDEKKNFLLKTSILDVLCGDLCDAMTGQSNGKNLLKSLSKGNSFLTPIDETGEWYRYHHLFKEMLYSLLMKNLPSQATELYQKSAHWYHENGYPRLAIEHYLASGRYEHAISLIEKQSIGIIDSGHSASALAWIHRLPQDLVESSLEITAIQAANEAENDNFAASQHLISRMENIAASSRYASAEAKKYVSHACMLTEAYCLILKGDMIAVNSLLKTVTMNEGAQFNLIKYIDFNPYNISFYRSKMHHLIELFGKHPDIYREMIGNYQNLMQRDPPGYGPLIAGEYLYEHDHLEESMDQLLSAMELATRSSCPGVLVPAMVTLAKISKARGDGSNALSTIDECESRLKPINQMHWNYLLRAFKARLLLESGDLDAAVNWFDTCNLGPYQDLSRAREFELLVYARFLIELGSISNADILLRRLLDFTSKLDRKHSTIEILNLLAISCQKQGEIAKALVYLDQSLAIGLEENYIRSYVDEGENLSALFGYFSANGKKQKTYVQTLLRHAARQSKTDDPHESGNHPPYFNLLTKQEHKVMQLLAEGYTNQQIACELGISLSTTKIHIGNIFSKLQVSSRIQCVNKAREIGLIQ